ncbi:hypothetical protein BBP00_00001613 [Phytophthora kernoviae]|uniref:DUF1697 domain-containing protein n=1 Tax=Phytophthora kernoviae TaxID=325452 RepID=A0A3F2RZR7_9STRA|nr:hypothetical protein BBP00_00001613 [Phytophthora kernoviae]
MIRHNPNSLIPTEGRGLSFKMAPKRKKAPATTSSAVDDAPKAKRTTRASIAAITPAAGDDTVQNIRPAAATTTTKVVAFLRGVNVGGRTHSMKSISEALGAAGFDNVQTFLASGNIIFDGPVDSSVALSSTDTEHRVEETLEELFGSDIPVFVRSLDDVAHLEQQVVKTATAVNVALLKENLTTEQRKTLETLSTDEDELKLLDKAFVWYSATKMSESPLFKSRTYHKIDFVDIDASRREIGGH